MAHNTMSIQEILKLLPHRYPFLLVDRINEIISGEYIKAHKNITFNEPFFQGHFPGLPIMPGVLILEAMAQASGITILHAILPSDLENKFFFFTGIENTKFRHQVTPGDRLDLECKLVRHRLQLWKFSCQAFVDNTIVAEADITAAMVNKEDF